MKLPSSPCASCRCSAASAAEVQYSCIAASRPAHRVPIAPPTADVRTAAPTYQSLHFRLKPVLNLDKQVLIVSTAKATYRIPSSPPAAASSSVLLPVPWRALAECTLRPIHSLNIITFCVGVEGGKLVHAGHADLRRRRDVAGIVGPHRLQAATSSFGQLSRQYVQTMVPYTEILCCGTALLVDWPARHNLCAYAKRFKAWARWTKCLQGAPPAACQARRAALAPVARTCGLQMSAPAPDAA